jgi:hypothetical protein
MVDDFHMCIRPTETQVDSVSLVEPVVEMEDALAPPEPETPAAASNVPSNEPSQGTVDSEEPHRDGGFSMWFDPELEAFMNATPSSTDPSLVPSAAGLGVSLQETVPQEEPVPTVQEESMLSFLVEPAAETEAQNVTMGEGLAAQQAIIQSSTPLPFAMSADTPFVLPSAQSGPPTPQIQRAANDFMIDTDIIIANFSKPKPDRTISVSTQPPSGSSILTQISVSSVNRSQTSPAIGVSLTYSDENKAQTKTLAASGSAPLVVPRWGKMVRVRRFSPASRQPMKKSAAADLSDIGYIPIRLLDEEDILPKENGADSEFEDDD